MELPNVVREASAEEWMGICGIAGFVLAETLLGGFVGLLVGGLVFACWIRFPPEYAFAFGQFALGMFLPEFVAFGGGGGVEPAVLWFGEAGLLALLVASSDVRSPTLLVATLGVVGLGAVGGWTSVYWLNSTWVAVVGGACLAAIIAGGLRRYGTHDAKATTEP